MSGMEEQSTFHCSSELQWQPNSPLCRRLCISDNGPQSTKTHRSLLHHDYSQYFYLCTNITVHMLRVAANSNKTKPLVSPWDRFLEGLTGYLWIDPYSQWGTCSTRKEMQKAGSVGCFPADLDHCDPKKEVFRYNMAPEEGCDSPELRERDSASVVS